MLPTSGRAAMSTAPSWHRIPQNASCFDKSTSRLQSVTPKTWLQIIQALRFRLSTMDMMCQNTQRLQALIIYLTLLMDSIFKSPKCNRANPLCSHLEACKFSNPPLISTEHLRSERGHLNIPHYANGPFGSGTALHIRSQHRTR